MNSTKTVSDADAENAKCGICMLEVVDRGVLDCCNHWFCFSCIDNWAIITNLCPLCKSQFEIITCVPVFDTLQSKAQQNYAIEGTDSDDSWLVPGKNNALSFPSYYIEENAILCLDGNSCKIRSGNTKAEEASSLETSVACDSCDIWYHAACVQFNQEISNENKWFCPRCKTKDAPGDSKSDLFEASETKSTLDLEVNHNEISNGKMLIEVADVGETAVVISRVEDSPPIQTIKNQSEVVESSGYGKNGENNSLPSPSVNGIESIKPSEVNHPLHLDNNLKTLGGRQDAEAAKSQNLTSSVVNECGLHPSTGTHEKSNPLSVLQKEEIFSFRDTEATIGSNSSGNVCILSSSVDNDFILESCISDTKGRKDAITDLGISSSHMNSEKLLAEKDCNGTDDEGAEDTARENLCCKKRKYEGMENNRETPLPLESPQNQEHVESSSPIQASIKRSKPCDFKEQINIQPLGGEYANVCLTNNSIRAEKSQSKITDDAISSQLRDLIREPERVSRKLLPHSSTAFEDEQVKKGESGKPEMVSDNCQKNTMVLSSQPQALERKADQPACLEEEQNTFGSFVESEHKQNASNVSVMEPCSSNCKIMEHTFSSQLQDLKRKPKSSNFVKSVPSSSISATNNGAERDQFTSVRMKKILPRRLADDKSALVNEIKKELKIESVSDTTGNLHKFDISDERLFAAFKAAMVKAREISSRNNIVYSQLKTSHKPHTLGKIRENLTKKLYGTGNGKRRRGWDRIWELEFWKGRCDKAKELKKADNSDSVTDTLKKNLEACSKPAGFHEASEKDEVDPILSRLYLADNSVFPRKGKIKPLSLQLQPGGIMVDRPVTQSQLPKTEKKTLPRNSGVLSSAAVSTSHLVSSNEHPERKNSKSSLSSSTMQTNEGQKKLNNDEDLKEKKRKWALEVLARKTGGNGNKSEASMLDNKKFPLLSQLPTDMLPILPHNRQSKVPTAIRQMQLNRLVEYYLKSSNLEVIQRTAATEFAVADAVNKEKEIYERSNSKNVYLNLCAQTFSQRPCGKKTINEDSCHDQESDLDKEIKANLSAAGLISDSPPGSPYSKTANHTECDAVMEEMVSSPVEDDNILNLVSSPALDIYGDFEYDLDDIEVPGPSKLSIGSSQPTDVPSKLKVILSDTAPGTMHSDQRFVEDGKQCSSKNPLSMAQEIAHPDLVNKKDTESVVLSLNSSMDSGCVQQTDNHNLLESNPEQSYASSFQGQGVLCTHNSLRHIESKTEDCIHDVKQQQTDIVHLDDVARTSELKANSETGDISSKAEHTVDAVNKGSEAQKNQNILERYHSTSKKVEAYVKEHIRPLCKSGVVTVEQYRWAVRKTVEKVMKYHQNAKSADFLISEGNKVKKLSEQYLQAFKKERH